MDWENVQEEFSDYIEHGFEPFVTEDGSLTLASIKRSGEKDMEPMHSKRGAFSESKFIYSEGCELYINKNPTLKHLSVVSVGLGLGYNELLTTNVCIEAGVSNFEIFSYEKESVLVEAFIKRVECPLKYPIFWKPFKEMLGHSDKLLKLQKNVLEKIKHCGELSKDNTSPFAGCVMVCFDAYSNKTSKELWDEMFLNGILQLTTSGSVFCTYASTGNLNRALKKNDYVNINKSGFKGKRQSTCSFKK